MLQLIQVVKEEEKNAKENNFMNWLKLFKNLIIFTINYIFINIQINTYKNIKHEVSFTISVIVCKYDTWTTVNRQLTFIFKCENNMVFNKKITY